MAREGIGEAYILYQEKLFKVYRGEKRWMEVGNEGLEKKRKRGEGKGR